MTWWILLSFAPVALTGHVGFWLLIWNRVHGTAMPRWMVSAISNFAKACTLILPVMVAGVFWNHRSTDAAAGLATIYFCTVMSFGVVSVPWAFFRRQSKKSVVEPVESSTILRTCREAKYASLESADLRTRLLLNLPGNQTFEFEQNELVLEIPRLSEKLDGLTIAHLTDLHFTGKVSKSYFDQAIDTINGMDADIVAVTGDIVDNNKYISWIPVTIGRLQAKHGVYAILGNHDCRCNLSAIRLALAEAGVDYIGGTVRELEIHGKRVLLAGNELPWIPPAPDMTDFQRPADVEQLRILLAHTPDEFFWARHFDFDLMLAGHTHGGQIRIPGFGPFVCPSRLPLEYATGIRYETPTTLSVSRGLSGELPLRLNCRPEITRLVLRATAVESKESEAAESTLLQEVNALRDEAMMEAGAATTEAKATPLTERKESRDGQTPPTQSYSDQTS